jgi:hypothetical protein
MAGSSERRSRQALLLLYYPELAGFRERTTNLRVRARQDAAKTQVNIERILIPSVLSGLFTEPNSDELPVIRYRLAKALRDWAEAESKFLETT